jgi:hypothetical protein
LTRIGRRIQKEIRLGGLPGLRRLQNFDGNTLMSMDQGEGLLIFVVITDVNETGIWQGILIE